MPKLTQHLISDIKKIVLTISAFTLLFLSGCQNFPTPNLSIQKDWPHQFHYEMAPKLINGCIDISGVYLTPKKFVLKAGELKEVEAGSIGLTSFFASKIPNDEKEITPNLAKGKYQKDFIQQTDTNILESFYRYDGTKRYTRKLIKNKNYRCTDNSIVFGDEHHKYGGDGTFVNYKIYVEIRGVEDGVLLYEAIANPRDTNHYYYFFPKE